MKIIFLLAFISCFTSFSLSEPGDSRFNPITINVLAGTNLTLKSVFYRQMISLSWIHEENINKSPHATLPSFFVGQKLCAVTTEKITIFEYYPLRFNCNNVELDLFHTTPAYNGIYNAKQMINLTEYITERNTYFELHVLDIPAPKCEITSRYLDMQATGDDYCLIEINCTNSKYPAKVIFNGRQSKLYHYVSERGGNKNLPNFYETIITVNGTHKSFEFQYPFNDLCQTTHSLEYDDDGDTALNVFAILIIVLSVLVIIASIILLYCHRRKVQARIKNEPVHIRLQK